MADTAEVENDNYKNVPGNRDGTVSLEKFKHIATEAIAEHESLKMVYFDQQRELEELRARLQDTEDNLVKLTSVSQKACEEMVTLHEDLETQIDVEQRCREKAEEYASKMVNENKKILKENRDIKRKSMALLGRAGVDFKMVEISLDDITDEESASPEEDEMKPEHRLMLEELEHQVESLKHELQKAKNEKDQALEDMRYYKQENNALIEQLALESTSHEVTKAALKERDKTLEKLNRVSTIVIQEYQDVSTKYEEATVLKEQAESFAAKMYSEKEAADAARRQSLLMLNDTLEDNERVAELLQEVEKLTTTVEEERLRHKKELKDAEERLQHSEQATEQETLLEKLRIADEELSSSEMRIKELEEKNKLMEKKIADMEEAARPPPPPAPPPPPPPFVPKNPLKFFTSGIFKTMVNKNAKGGVKGGTKKQDPLQKSYEATIEEMMNRIKRGQVQLRPVQEKKQPEQRTSGKGPQAVQELDSILKTIKKNRGDKFTAIPPNKDQEDGRNGVDSDFMKIMAKRRQMSSVKTPDVTSKALPGSTQEPPVAEMSNPPAAETHDAPAAETPKPPALGTPEPVQAPPLSPTHLGSPEVKKSPVPAPRISVRQNQHPQHQSDSSSSNFYHDIQPKPNGNHLASSLDMEVQENPVYDSVDEDHGSKSPKPVPKFKVVQQQDPDDPNNLYSLVQN